MTLPRAITFDVGGKLIEPWPSVGAVYAEVAQEYGLPCSAEVLDANFASGWKSRSNFSYSRADWMEVVCHTFKGCHEVSPALFDAIYTRFNEPRCWHVYDDVYPTLKQLAGWNLKLGIVSNWDERLIPLLEKLQLADFFQVIVVSSSVGAHKPDRKIFEYAAHHLAVPPSQILHIGDRNVEDITGANGAGLQALRVCRQVGSQPFELQALTDLLQWLKPVKSQPN